MLVPSDPASDPDSIKAQDDEVGIALGILFYRRLCYEMLAKDPFDLR
jgi:hypothetical protein